MKKNFTFVFAPTVALAVAVAGFSSCVQNPDGNKTPRKVSKVEELVVPADFSWKTSVEVAASFTAGHLSKVALSLSPSAAPFATFAVGEGAEPVSLSIPAAVQKLYVSYEKEEGFSTPAELTVTDGTVAYNVPADAEFYADVAASGASGTANAGKDNGNFPNSKYDPILYPATGGWGTIMFEDLWPGFGDFDFNDLAINYKIVLYPNNRNKVRDMDITFRVRSIGGSLPNKLYLRMDGVTGGQMDVYAVSGDRNTLDEPAAVFLNPAESDKNPAVIRFDGIYRNANAPKGVAYLNTQEGYERTDDLLVEATFRFHFRNSIFQRDVSFDKFNFFIARETESIAGLKEIHGGGYTPSQYGWENYNGDKRNKNVDTAEDYFYANNGLVWMLSVPADIPHAYENIDFLKAYPHFRDWAESGGQSHVDWYSDEAGNRVRKNLVGGR